MLWDRDAAGHAALCTRSDGSSTDADDARVTDERGIVAWIADPADASRMHDVLCNGDLIDERGIVDWSPNRADACCIHRSRCNGDHGAVRRLRVPRWRSIDATDSTDCVFGD